LFIGVITGQRKLLQPPTDNMTWDPLEEQAVNQMLAYSFIGSKETLKTKLDAFVEKTGVNEIMATSHIFDQRARLHSYELFSQVINELNMVHEG
jgi:alkanesulfonate monooxygenase SsuD/methylene tetrahydromethanopterin reductase-like flavin-dependent oxidoreductase (luciferase family)